MAMKQRITPEQLNELTDEQKKKLREWYYPEKVRLLDQYIFHENGELRKTAYYSDYFFDDKESDLTRHFRECKALPILTIGQMIELITSLDPSQFLFEYRYNFWSVQASGTTQCGGVAIDRSWQFDDLELCDALFEIVKQTL